MVKTRAQTSSSPVEVAELAAVNPAAGGSGKRSRPHLASKQKNKKRKLDSPADDHAAVLTASRDRPSDAHSLEVDSEPGNAHSIKHRGAPSEEQARAATSVIDTSLAPSSSRIRFNSEEPIEIDTQPAAGAATVEPTKLMDDGEVEIEDDSEDDAPEDVTTSAALEKAKASAASAAQAASRQKRAQKLKRQELAARLKHQSEASTSRQAARSAQLATEQPRSTTTVKSNALPALLPADVLAAEPTMKTLIPPRSRRTKLLESTKRHHLPAKERSAKEIVKGPVTVSVLESIDSRLPPKASTPSRSLKEAWLAGRRGLNGVGSFTRKKANQGFLRA